MIFQLPHYGTQPQLVTKYFEESLKNLQLDYIDLYLMHAPYYVPETDAYDQQGKLKIINNDFVAVWKVNKLKFGKCVKYIKCIVCVCVCINPLHGSLNFVW